MLLCSRHVFKSIFRHTAIRASQDFPCKFCNNVYASTPLHLDHIAGYSPAIRMSCFQPSVLEGFLFVVFRRRGISLDLLTALWFSPAPGLCPQALPGAAAAVRHRCRRPSARSPATKQPWLFELALSDACNIIMFKRCIFDALLFNPTCAKVVVHKSASSWSFFPLATNPGNTLRSHAYHTLRSHLG